MSEALVEGIMLGHTEEVRYLISAGISVNAALPGGMLPVNIALSHHHEDIALLLLENGARPEKSDPFSLDECERQPIHYAAACGAMSVVEVLLDKGVSVNAMDYGYSTPLHHAAAHGRLTIAEYLISRGADVNHCSKSGRSALWKAAQANCRRLVQYLYSHGADVNLQSKVGATVLFDVIKENHLEIIYDLFRMGIDTSLTDISGNTCMHAAAGLGRTQAALMLIDHGVDLDTSNENGNRPIHVSVIRNMVVTSVCLLNHGAKKQAPNGANQSPMYVAMLHCNHESVHMLYAAGCNITAHDRRMYKNYEVCRSQKKEDFFNWLQNLLKKPSSLMQLCRRVVRNQLGSNVRKTDQLPIPSAHKAFLLLEDIIPADLAMSSSAYTEE
jgi:ankyrin repeat protein